MIFRHTIINHFFLSFPKSPIIARRHLEQKSAVGPTLAQRQQNIETYNPSSDWQANVGPTSAQRRQNLPTLRPTVNVGPTAECYLGTNIKISGVFINLGLLGTPINRQRNEHTQT